MKIILILICSFLLFNGFTQVTDIDNYSYKTVVIGNQTWMAENLNTSKFRNGDLIPEAKTAEEWKKAGEEGAPVWCYYNFDSRNGKRYGKIYNWHCIADIRGIAPDGFHIPDTEEWSILSNYMGGAATAGTKMKSKNGWQNNGNGSNQFLFNGLPGGCNYNDGNNSFISLGEEVGWWSSSTSGLCCAVSYSLSYNKESLDSFYHSFMDWGMYIRCIKE